MSLRHDELELALLLSATCAARESAGARIRYLSHTVNLTTLAVALEHRRLLPLLGSRLLGATANNLDERFRNRVVAALARDRAAGMVLEAYTDRLLATLAHHGIPALELKGPRLAQRVHHDIGLRASADVDLLVAKGDLHGAVSALRREGYATPADPITRAGLPHLHFALRHRELPPVELHWRVHWHEEAFSADMLARATQDAERALVLDDIDEGAALLLFFARDGFQGLRTLADITGWWDERGQGLKSGLLDAHAQRYPELARTWGAAARAAEAIGRVPVRSWLTAPRSSDRRTMLALRLASWSEQSDRDQLEVNMALVDGLLTPPHSLTQFLQRLLDAPTSRPLLHLAKVTVRSLAALGCVRRETWDPLPDPRRPENLATVRLRSGQGRPASFPGSRSLGPLGPRGRGARFARRHQRRS